ncbi:MAG: hypothetical protein IPL52_08840 [Flavobacteriales bacterium]|nr:hypothetical protein [Flavobacteriales bacterium]
MRNVQRHGFFTEPPTDVEQVLWTYQYAYGKSRLATVLAGTGSALPTRQYQYDAAGNLVRDYYRDHKTTYGRAQLPFAVTLGNTAAHAAAYLYDAADQRVYKREIDENGAIVSEAFHLRDAAGRELGVLETEGVGENATSAWTWYAGARPGLRTGGTQRFAKTTPLQQPDPNGAQGGGLPFTYTNAYGSNSLKRVSYYRAAASMLLHGQRAAIPCGMSTVQSSSCWRTDLVTGPLRPC